MTEGNDPNEKMGDLFGGAGDQSYESGDQQEGAQETPEQKAERLMSKYKVKSGRTTKGKSTERNLKSKERMLDGAASFDSALDRIEDRDEKREAIEERVEEMLTELFAK